MMKKGDIFVNFGKGSVSAFAPKTWPERVEIKHMIGDFTTKKAFIQKGFNSNLEIPGYNDPTLNGKGYTFNQLPHERYDDSVDSMLYKPGAYASGKHSVRPAADVQKGMDLAKKLAEENKALGGSPEANTLVKSAQGFDYRKLKMPEWICSSICAGLNMDDVVSGDSSIEDPEYFNMSDSNLFRTEED
jgi:hypothetical protein